MKEHESYIHLSVDMQNMLKGVHIPVSRNWFLEAIEHVIVVVVN